MPPRSHSPDIDEAKANRTLFWAFVGSTPFKAVIGAIGSVLLVLLVLGWRNYITSAASDNADVKGVVIDVHALKGEVKVLNDKAQDHTFQLEEANKQRQDAAVLQAKIFDAIQGVRKDVQALEIHVGKLDQRFDDLNSKK